MRAVGTTPWLGLSFLETLFFGVLALAVPTLRRLPAAPLWLAAAWVGMEYVRCDWPLGWMPWGRLAYAVVGTPLAPALPYAGSTGLSLVLALSGALLAAAWWARGRRRWVPVGVLVGLAAVSVLPNLAPYTSEPDGEITVAAIQGNVPGDGTNVLAHYREVTHNHVAVTKKLGAAIRAGTAPRPDFVVWPENSTAIDPFYDQQMREDISTALAAVNVPILVGAVVDGGPKHVLNQGIVFDPVTGAGDRYTKWHPVAFGDHFAQLSQVPRDMVRGTRVTPLAIGGAKVADAICFDVAYDDGIYAQISHGGQLVVVQTSNALFIHTSQIDQQFAISRLRAMETHRFVVVAAINGLTGVIAPDGSVVSSVTPRTAAFVDQKVALDTGITPAVRIGPWLGRACLLLAAMAWLVGLGRGVGRYRRARKPEVPVEVTAPPMNRTFA
jgi:apolipoprotein N-acyltransferase